MVIWFGSLFAQHYQKKKVPTTVNSNELLLFIINCSAPTNKVNDP